MCFTEIPRVLNVVAINVGHNDMLETHYEAVARGGHNSCTPIYVNIDLFNYSSVRGEDNEIQSGRNNTINGNFNAILGGSNNNISNFNYVGIFGNGVLAVRDEAFHANNYLISNMLPFPTVIRELYFEVGTCALNIG